VQVAKDIGVLVCHNTGGFKAANVALGRAYMARAGLAGRVEFKTGDALELIDAEEGPFDIIFNDIDKNAYPEVLPRALPKLKEGGLLLSDNTLWSGRVTAEADGDWTAGVQAYNLLVSSNPGLITTIIPLRDGVSVSLKL